MIRTFRHMEEVWGVRVKKMGSDRPGHRAYAARETERWNRWAGIAQMEFAKVTEVKSFLL